MNVSTFTSMCVYVYVCVCVQLLMFTMDIVHLPPMNVHPAATHVHMYHECKQHIKQLVFTSTLNLCAILHMYTYIVFTSTLNLCANCVAA
jgi:hypothetical protein